MSYTRLQPPSDLLFTLMHGVTTLAYQGIITHEAAVDALSTPQLESKLMLAQMLDHHLGGNPLEKHTVADPVPKRLITTPIYVEIMGGWIGVQALYCNWILDRYFAHSTIYSVDRDSYCIEAAPLMASDWNHLRPLRRSVQFCREIQFFLGYAEHKPEFGPRYEMRAPVEDGTVRRVFMCPIAEHMTDDALGRYFDHLPEGAVVILSSTNMPAPDHLFPSRAIENFVVRCHHLVDADVLETQVLNLRVNNWERHAVTLRIRGHNA